ncbi:MAG: 23S rRNA (guanosine(2251)-2'-O)-methyltransferase RlmB, partial [Bacteroidota bacterium]
IEANQTIDKVYLQQALDGPLLKQLKYLIKEKGISFNYVPVEKLNRLSKGNHQGAIAQVSPINFVDLEDLLEQSTQDSKVPLFMVLDQLSDVRNFGAILRTAECTGVSGVIIQKQGSAPINADAVKTSAGAVFNIPIAKVDHIKDAIYFLQGSGIKTIAATEKASQLVYNVDLKSPIAIIMGSEGKGINPSVLKIVDELVKLPVLGKIESLNVSVACGALLYEALRQRL